MSYNILLDCRTFSFFDPVFFAPFRIFETTCSRKVRGNSHLFSFLSITLSSTAKNNKNRQSANKKLIAKNLAAKNPAAKKQLQTAGSTHGYQTRLIGQSDRNCRL
ncbi:MAG: hypothetical protein CSB48_01310 [Proteobacteria bacterium]|nr:MAG: hypothetical protein CSB48_01310 [Pseudomonadota bacterium]